MNHPKNSKFEKIKLAQLEEELELVKVRNESSQSASLLTVKAKVESVNNNLENFIKSNKTLMIVAPSRAESFNIFFLSLDKAFRTKNVPDKFKAEILLNIVSEKSSNLMIYVSEEDLRRYDKLKTNSLKGNSNYTTRVFKIISYHRRIM